MADFSFLTLYTITNKFRGSQPAEVDVLRDEGIAYGRRLGKENEAWTQLWLARRVPHPFPHQVEASEVAAEFRQLAIQRLSQAFKGELTKKEFITNV